MAIRSDWTRAGGKRRHCVLLFSNGKVRELGGSQRLLTAYPQDMPQNIDSLTECWEEANFEKQRLNIFFTAVVPNEIPWINMQSWNRFWIAFSDKCGTDLDDVDKQCWIDLFVDND